LSNGIALVLAIALVAALFALVVVVLRRSPGRVPARPADAEPASPQDDAQRQRALADATSEADQIRARAESAAGAIVSSAEAAASQSAEARREVESEIRAVKEEVRLLRSDLERREARLAEREQRIDEDARKADQRSDGLDELQRGISRERAELERLGEERRAVLERAASLTADQAKAELVAVIENQA
jgi:ribonuclease Y